jgi:hypothetical protein
MKLLTLFSGLLVAVAVALPQPAEDAAPGGTWRLNILIDLA